MRTLPAGSGLNPRRRTDWRKPTFSARQVEGAQPGAPCPLRKKFQRELDQPRRLGRQNLIESWRTDVAVGKTEIGMVEDVEELRPELKFLRLRDANVLERGKVPVGVARPLRDVAARGAELLHGGIGVLNDSAEMHLG